MDECIERRGDRIERRDVINGARFDCGAGHPPHLRGGFVCAMTTPPCAFTLCTPSVVSDPPPVSTTAIKRSRKADAADSSSGFAEDHTKRIRRPSVYANLRSIVTVRC